VLVFIGPSGAGKTRVGKRVARLLGVPFTDTDSLIAQQHGPISEIFAEHGEPHFRALERRAVQEGLAGDGVLSLGGGAVLYADTQADLAGHRVVLLTISPEAVESRLGGDRPLVKNGLTDWIALNAPRWQIYDRLAHVTIDTSYRESDEIAEEVAAWART
jgi:shikimate kinase